MFYASCLFCKNPCYKNIINLEDLLFPCHESLQGRIQNAVYKRKKHLKELISDRGTEKIESSMAIGRVHLLRILFICDLVNSITHNKDCLWSLYIKGLQIQAPATFQVPHATHQVCEQDRSSTSKRSWKSRSCAPCLSEVLRGTTCCSPKIQ